MVPLCIHVLYNTGGNPTSNVCVCVCGGGGGGDSPSSKCLGQFFRHGVGVSSYTTNLYNQQASQKKGGLFRDPKIVGGWVGGHLIFLTFQIVGGGGGDTSPWDFHPCLAQIQDCRNKLGLCYLSTSYATNS